MLVSIDGFSVSGTFVTRPMHNPILLKLTCHEHCKLGMANCDTIYFKSMALIQERCMGRV